MLLYDTVYFRLMTYRIFFDFVTWMPFKSKKIVDDINTVPYNIIELNYLNGILTLWKFKIS